MGKPVINSEKLDMFKDIVKELTIRSAYELLRQYKFGILKPKAIEAVLALKWRVRTAGDFEQPIRNRW